ncbi:MAG: hybrid sensor histidine kinase/response regulator [Verrucomicrobiota bacterium]
MLSVTRPDAEPNSDLSSQVNILMVDDSPDKLLAMESVLSDLGPNLVKASSGEEALRLLLKGEFALILLDVNMPGMSGFETAQLIRKRKSLERIPIIFVTALSTTDADIFKGYSFGAVDYILTPIIPEILKTKVGVFIDLWKQRRELLAQAEALKALNTALETRAQQLGAANRELETFCYTVAHDLRAPLRAMEGLTSILLEDYAEKLDNIANDYGQRIRSSASRMDQMIQELLAYSRLTLVEFQSQPVRLSRAIKDALAQLAWDLEKKNATVDWARSKVMVQGHYAMVVQVIVNLISNALKFVRDGEKPAIKIWDEEREGMVRVWVEDNGIGIASEHQNRIFRIFERLHGRENYTGTGIGLAIVEKAATRMNGRVGVESVLGSGSRFWFELPTAADVNTEAETKGH